MKAIHKYQLDPQSKVHALELKEGFQVVRAEYVLAHKSVCIWVEVPLSVEVPIQRVNFRLVSSGEPVPSDSRYLATAIDSFTPESYHLYTATQQQLEGEADRAA